MAEKQRLKIRRWDVENNVPAEGKPFEAMLNPTDYEIGLAVSLTPESRPDGTGLETLTLAELVLDGTGVVPAPDGMPASVEAQLAELQAIMTIRKEADAVVMPVVLVVWGTLYFIGRLESLSSKYTLFAPDGTPLRAKVNIKLAEYEKGDRSGKEARTPQEMSRQLRLGAEVRLPELCFQAYKDTAMLELVARHNDLTSFRNVPAGTRITCPPKR